jgi:hypothetical protein
MAIALQDRHQPDKREVNLIESLSRDYFLDGETWSMARLS